METMKTPDGAPLEKLVPSALLEYLSRTWDDIAPMYNIRVGAEPHNEREEALRRRKAKDGRVTRVCGLTGRRFTLPVGTPAPAIIYQFGEDPDSRAYGYTVHPEIMQAGPEAVERAMREQIERLADKVQETSLALYDLLAFARAGLRPDWPNAWRDVKDE